MKKLLTAGLSLLAVILLVSSFSRAAETQQDVPFPGGTLVNPCNDEEIALAPATIHVNTHTFTTGNGQIKMQIHENTLLHGIGTSGASYVLPLDVSEIENINGTGATEASVVANEKMIGQGPSSNLRVHILEHFTINANGIIVIDRFEVSQSCSKG